MSGYRTLLVNKISDLYLLQVLRYRDSNRKNEKDKKNWRNGLFAIFPMLLVKF